MQKLCMPSFSGYVRILMFKRLWVRILVLDNTSMVNFSALFGVKLDCFIEKEQIYAKNLNKSLSKYVLWLSNDQWQSLCYLVAYQLSILNFSDGKIWGRDTFGLRCPRPQPDRSIRGPAGLHISASKLVLHLPRQKNVRWFQGKSHQAGGQLQNRFPNGQFPNNFSSV